VVCNPAQPFNITPAREFTLEADAATSTRGGGCCGCGGVTRTLRNALPAAGCPLRWSYSRTRR